MRIEIPAILVLASALALACGPSRGPDEADGQASGSGSGTAPTTGTAMSMGSTEGVGTSTGAADTGGDGNAFVFPPDLGFPDCALGAGECPEGFKCNPAGPGQNDTPQCVPVVPDPRAPGEPCSVLGDLADGTDDCQADVVCMFPDAQGIGECHAICEVACGAGQLCVPLNVDWTCVIDASGDEGQAGDPCEFINVCDPALTCIDASRAPGCGDSSGCCSPFCSTDQPNTCPNAALGEVCVPWYAGDDAPPQLTTLGVCAVPT